MQNTAFNLSLNTNLPNISHFMAAYSTDNRTDPLVNICDSNE